MVEYKYGVRSIMNRTKIQPLILLSLLINAIAMGLFAYDNYHEKNIGYTVTFIVLCLYLMSLAIYGLVRNSQVSRTSK
ncbi:hypothetical protein AC622_11780 [Bacillus sp. FJAT-27916]|nr:hypothetical protein AC622_11780 [Bacillus sp. FJAT-27916]